MQLTKEKRGECSILLVHGRLDGTTSPKFETEVLGWLSTGGKSFVLDMAGISFMSSAALRVLLSMAKRVARTGGKVVLSSPNAVVSEVFEISNFSAMFTICQTLDEGVTAATQGMAASAPAAAAPPAATEPAPKPAPAPVPPPPVAPPVPAPVVPPPAAAKPEAPPAAPTPPPAPAPAPAPVAPPVAHAPAVPPIPPPTPVKVEAVTPTAPPVAPPVPAAPATVAMPASPAPAVPAAAEPPPKPVAAATPPPAAPTAPAPAAPPPIPAEPKPAPTAPPPPAAPTPAPAAKKAGPRKLELVVGTHVVECRDGDVIGSEGTVAKHLFKSATSLQPRHILIGKGPDSWFVMVPRNVQVVTHLDDAVLNPGVRQNLSNEHRLAVGDFAFSLRLSEAQERSVNESFFKRLFKLLNLD